MYTPFDQYYMQQALELARHAAQQDEVPVGAVLVHEDKIIGMGWNQPIARHDPSAHAEMVALRAGGLQLENYRLLNTTLYVTLEPCAMCLGTIIHARVSRLVYGAKDPKTGMLGGALNLLDILPWSHPLTVEGGLLAAQSTELLQDFFKSRR